MYVVNVWTSGDARFVSATYRLFKLPPKDQFKDSRLVIYNGEITGYEEEVIFDHKYTFKVIPSLTAIVEQNIHISRDVLSNNTECVTQHASRYIYLPE